MKCRCVHRLLSSCFAFRPSWPTPLVWVSAARAIPDFSSPSPSLSLSPSSDSSTSSPHSLTLLTRILSVLRSFRHAPSHMHMYALFHDAQNAAQHMVLRAGFPVPLRSNPLPLRSAPPRSYTHPHAHLRSKVGRTRPSRRRPLGFISSPFLIPSFLPSFSRPLS